MPCLLPLKGLLLGALLPLACAPPSTPSLPRPPAGAQLTAELSTAVEQALERVHAEPQSALRWRELAEFYDANSLAAEAEASYRAAFELDPGDARSRHLLARRFANAGDLQAAFELEREAALLAPKEAHVIAAHGELLLELGQVEEAREVLDEALGAGVDSRDVRWGLARAQVALGDAEAALATLAEALDEGAEGAYTHHLRASALRALGRLDEAESEAALGGRAVFDDPWTAEMNSRRIGFHGDFARVQASMESGDLAAALKRLTAMHEADPANVNVAGMLSDVLLELGRPGDAERMLLRTEALMPDNHRVPYNLAVVHEWMQDLDQALLDWTRALELHPRFTMALVRRARLQASRGSFDEAEADLAQARELGDVSVDWFRQSAQLQATQGDLPRAIATLDAGALRHPREAILALLQAELRAALGDADGANQALERAARLDPKHERLERVRASVERRLAGGGR